jgi:hypothetical protein
VAATARSAAARICRAQGSSTFPALSERLHRRADRAGGRLAAPVAELDRRDALVDGSRVKPERVQMLDLAGERSHRHRMARSTSSSNVKTAG